MGERVKVLFITGWCRNGSTLVGNILNEVDGLFHTGELHFLWKNAYGRGSNSSCGCGAPLRECPVWSKVLAAVMPPGVAEQAHAEHIVQRQGETVRARHTWRVLGRAPSDELRRHAETMAAAYEAIAATTGARVIVDSGKMPAEAALLPRIAGIEPVYLHLVRDPRATAHSWASQKDYIRPMPAWKSTAYWVGFNVASHAVTRRHADRALFVRYEDFIARPEPMVDAILRLCGESPASNPVRGRAVTLGPNHTVTGNPDRFRVGDTDIRGVDDAWRRALPKGAMAVASALSWPLRVQYGYGARPGSDSAAGG